MKEVSEEIYSYFSNLPAFTSVMGESLFPLVALEETQFPFCVYAIQQQSGLSKDGSSFEVIMSAYFNAENYLEATNFNDAMVLDFKNNANPFDYQDSSIDFLQDNQSIILTITFKKE